MPPTAASPHAIEGTRAHELLDYCMSHAFEYADSWMPWGDDAEKVASVQMVLDYVADLRERYPDLKVLHEERFVFPQQAVPPGEAAGIADILCYSAATTDAWVIDFKFGQGIVVEAEHNEQALFYATGALFAWPVSSIHCVIIQPRAFHPAGPVRTWTTDAHALIEFSDRVEQAILAAEQPDTCGVPGKHCRFCAAAVVCPEREQQALAVATDAFANVRDIDQIVLPEPQSLDLQRIARILAGKDALREWLQAVEVWAEQSIRSGAHIPGFKLVEAQARRAWQGDVEEVAAKLSEISGVPAAEFLPQQLVTVGLAERTVVQAARHNAPRGKKDEAAKQAKEAMAFLTLRQSSGNLTLVPESDPRPSAIAKAFAGVNILPPPA